MLIHRFVTIMQRSMFPRRLLAFGAAFALVHFPARAVDVVPPEVEKAILAENWREVVQLLPGVETNEASATLRLIKGHACLALNQNNESFSLFLSVKSRKEHTQYQDWAISFKNRNPDKAAAFYFEGDAFARLTNWARAEKAFNDALKIEPTSSLCQNARGVVYAQQDKILLAKTDFSEAAKNRGIQLADSHANAGYLWIQRKEDAKKAQEEFIKALAISPQCALALHGKGCAELVSGSYESAADDLKKADEHGDSFVDVLFANEAHYAIYALGVKPGTLFADLKNPAMSLSERVDKADLFSSARTWFSLASQMDKANFIPFNQHVRDWASGVGLSTMGKMYAQGGASEITDFKNQNPQLNNVISVEASHWSSPGSAGSSRLNIEAGKIIFNEMANALPSVSDPKTYLPTLASGLVHQDVKLAADYLSTGAELRHVSLPAIQGVYGSSSPVLDRVVPDHNAAGVFAGMRLQDGNWPFKPLYGLGYGLDTNVVRVAE